jgi:hypothetical protein
VAGPGGPGRGAFDLAIPAQVFGDRRHAGWWAQEIPSEVRVPGHVYDVRTGLVSTVVDAKSRK